MGVLTNTRAILRALAQRILGPGGIGDVGSQDLHTHDPAVRVADRGVTGIEPSRPRRQGHLQPIASGDAGCDGLPKPLIMFPAGHVSKDVGQGPSDEGRSRATQIRCRLAVQESDPPLGIEVADRDRRMVEQQAVAFLAVAQALFRGPAARDVDQRRAAEPSCLPSFLAGNDADLQRRGGAIVADERCLDGVRRTVLGNLAQPVAEAIAVRPGQAGGQRAADQTTAVAADQPRPGEIDLANGGRQIQRDVPDRCVVVELGVPITGCLELGLGLAQLPVLHLELDPMDLQLVNQAANLVGLGGGQFAHPLPHELFGREAESVAIRGRTVLRAHR